MTDHDRPYPEGIAFDEAWQQRQRADAAESALQIESQVIRCAKKIIADNRQQGLNNLTESDWLQIEMAARGCVSGTSDEWPNLRAAIEKITGRPFGPRKTSSWLRGFCEGVMTQSDRRT